MAYSCNNKYLTLHEIKQGLNNNTLPFSVLNIKNPLFNSTALIDFYDKGLVEELKKWSQEDTQNEIQYCLYDMVGTTLFTRLIEEEDLDNLAFFAKKEPNFINVSHQNKDIISPFLSALVNHKTKCLAFLVNYHQKIDDKIKDELTILDGVIKHEYASLSLLIPFFETKHFEKSIQHLKEIIEDNPVVEELLSKEVDFLVKSLEKYQLEKLIEPSNTLGQNKKI